MTEQGRDRSVGCCRFCGMALPVPLDIRAGSADVDEWATRHCECQEAQAYAAALRKEDDREKIMRQAQDQLESIFGESTAVLGLLQVDDDTREMLLQMVGWVYDRKADKITATIAEVLKVTIRINRKGGIQIARAETRGASAEI